MRDPIAEQILTDELKSDRRWSYIEKIPLTHIDTKASRDNQSRLGEKIDLEWVTELVMTLVDGYELPALVGFYKKDGQIQLLSGNHRHDAYIKFIEVGGNLTHIDFYLVDNPASFEIEILARRLNVPHGKPLTNEAKEAHALYLIYNLKLPAAVAARKMGLNRSTVHRLKGKVEVKERLAKEGFTENLTQQKLLILYRIKMSKPLVEAAKTIIEMKLSDGETRELASKMIKATTESGQLGAIGDFKKKYWEKIPSKGGLKTTPAARFWRAAGVILSVRTEFVTPLDENQTRKAMKLVSKMEEIIAESK